MQTVMTTAIPMITTEVLLLLDRRPYENPKRESVNLAILIMCQPAEADRAHEDRN